MQLEIVPVEHQLTYEQMAQSGLLWVVCDGKQKVRIVRVTASKHGPKDYRVGSADHATFCNGEELPQKTYGYIKATLLL